MLRQTRTIMKPDALDFITNSTEIASVESIAIDMLKPFNGHPFKLYEGERLDDMVESIKENGILSPVIVRKLKSDYEILAGHNRVNAAKIAGLEQVPCIVKSGLSDEDAYVYVIETNMMQRSFNELLPSEKALVVSERYNSMKNQGKRNDIIRELKLLSGEELPEEENIGVDNRENVGKEYGLSGSSVARMLRINELIPAFKDMLDEGRLALMAGVHLSYLSEPKQNKVYDAVVANLGFGISPARAQAIRKLETDGLLNKDSLYKLFIKESADKEEVTKVHMPSKTYKRYFSDMTPKQAEEVIEKALEEYFATHQS